VTVLAFSRIYLFLLFFKEQQNSSDLTQTLCSLVWQDFFSSHGPPSIRFLHDPGDGQRLGSHLWIPVSVF